jgi:hyperosmotically inducible periplasmic protein
VPEFHLERASTPLATLLNVYVAEADMRTAGALLLTVLLILVAFFAVSYVTGSVRHSSDRNAVGTTGTIDVNAARERGAQVGEKVAVAAEKVKETAAEAALTSKIKAKMVLDDYVKARAIDVTTNDTTVTVSGTVRSADEHDRAIRIARETAGVTRVVDHLSMEK